MSMNMYKKGRLAPIRDYMDDNLNKCTAKLEDTRAQCMMADSIWTYVTSKHSAQYEMCNTVHSRYLAVTLL